LGLHPPHRRLSRRQCPQRSNARDAHRRR
jgi:hypothetical protein